MVFRMVYTGLLTPRYTLGVIKYQTQLVKQLAENLEMISKGSYPGGTLSAVHMLGISPQASIDA